MVVLLEDSPKSTEELELHQSDHLVLGHLSDQGPSPPIAQFRRAGSSRKSLGGSKRLPCQNDGGHRVLGPSMLHKCFGALPPDLCLDTVLSRCATKNSFNLISWVLL
jgi:hypothetical protein